MFIIVIRARGVDKSNIAPNNVANMVVEFIINKIMRPIFKGTLLKTEIPINISS